MKESKDIVVKEEIINSAQKLFKQYGLKKTTMDEIAAECGKAKSTLYHYFKNKEEVFDEVLIKEIKSLRSIVTVEVDKQTGFKEKLSCYFEVFHREAINKMNLHRILKQEVKQELGNSTRFSDVISFETNYVATMIKTALDNNEVSSIDKDDINMFSEILVVSFLSIVKYTIEKDGEFDSENLKKVTNLIIPKVFT